MVKNELMKRAEATLGRVNRLKDGIDLCETATKILAEQPAITVSSNYGSIALNDEEIGFSQETIAECVKCISEKILVRRDMMAEALIEVLEAIDEALPPEPVNCKQPVPQRHYGAISPDEVDW